MKQRRLISLTVIAFAICFIACVMVVFGGSLTITQSVGLLLLVLGINLSHVKGDIELPVEEQTP